MMSELARRAVACKHWRWAPGMLSRCATPTRRAVYRWLVGLDTRHYGIVCIVEDKHGRPCRSVALDPAWLPTCLDGQTLGAWVVEAPSRTRQTRHESYAAVLVAALEAAP